MLGDVLKNNLFRLKNASENKRSNDTFWIILRDIAKEEIIKHEKPIDSDIIIPIYYDILLNNLEYIPDYYKQILPSNHQERFRVITRNLFSSNAFHPDGLAMQEGIKAYKTINENKKGEKIVFQKQ